MKVLVTSSVVVLTILLTVLSLVAAAIVFTVAASVVPNSPVLVIISVLVGVGISFGLCHVALSRTRRRRDHAKRWMGRARTSLITAGAALVTVSSAAAIAFIPFPSERGRPIAPDNTQFTTLSTGSRVAWWKLASAHPTKPPIVMVHGGPGSYWGGPEQAFASLVDTGRDVYFYDQAGAGLSSFLQPRQYSVQQTLADLDAFRGQVMKSDRMMIVGHSNGGYISYASSAFHPEHVEKQVLIAPLNYGDFEQKSPNPKRDLPQPSPALASLVHLTLANTLFKANRSAAEAYMSQDDILRFSAALEANPDADSVPGVRTPPSDPRKSGGINLYVNQAFNADAEARFAEIDAAARRHPVPTLIERPEWDFIAWEGQRALRDQNRLATLVYVPGTSHTAWLVQPEASVAPIRAFALGRPLGVPAYTGTIDPRIAAKDSVR